MNRLEIRSLVRKNLGETTAAFWSDVELNSYINLAGHDVTYLTKCIRTNSYVTTVEDQMEYVPSVVLDRCIAILEVYLKTTGTTWLRLNPMTRRELDERFQGWLSWDSGTPTKYQVDIEEDVLRLLNPPDALNAGTDYLRVFYAQDFVELTDDDEVPDFTQELQNAMVDYVVGYGYQQRGWNEKSTASFTIYASKLRQYIVERNRRKEDEEIVMKSYRNI